MIYYNNNISYPPGTRPGLIIQTRGSTRTTHLITQLKRARPKVETFSRRPVADTFGCLIFSCTFRRDDRTTIIIMIISRSPRRVLATPRRKMNDRQDVLTYTSRCRSLRVGVAHDKSVSRTICVRAWSVLSVLKRKLATRINMFYHRLTFSAPLLEHCARNGRYIQYIIIIYC